MRAFILAAVVSLSVVCMARTNVVNRLQTTQGASSWYGRREQGRRMANGAPFDRNKYTAASRYYPLGTVLFIEYPKRSTFTYVVVTDRGPWVKGRVLDLSERAASTLGLKPDGVGVVRIAPIRMQ